MAMTQGYHKTLETDHGRNLGVIVQPGGNTVWLHVTLPDGTITEVALDWWAAYILANDITEARDLIA